MLGYTEHEAIIEAQTLSEEFYSNHSIIDLEEEEKE